MFVVESVVGVRVLVDKVKCKAEEFRFSLVGNFQPMPVADWAQTHFAQLPCTPGMEQKADPVLLTNSIARDAPASWSQLHGLAFRSWSLLPAFDDAAPQTDKASDWRCKQTYLWSSHSFATPRRRS